MTRNEECEVGKDNIVDDAFNKLQCDICDKILWITKDDIYTYQKQKKIWVLCSMKCLDKLRDKSLREAE